MQQSYLCLQHHAPVSKMPWRESCLAIHSIANFTPLRAQCNAHDCAQFPSNIAYDLILTITSPSKFQLSRHFEIGNIDLLPPHSWMTSDVYDTHSFP
jgi:hypothetical protein